MRFQFGKKSLVGFFAGSVLAFLLLGHQGTAVHAFVQEAAVDLETLSLQEVARGALRDSLYYRFDKWFGLFQEKIAQLESSPKTLETHAKLMQYHFFYAGLLGELSHALAFTSKFKVQKIEDDFFYHSTQAKKYAKKVLDHSPLATKQQAQAYLFLGAAEGYIGIFAYGAGHFFQALINGFRADNHLEQALELDPQQMDAYLGLGIYRYGNSRLGGFGNFLMQGGRDLRLVGLNHIEKAIREKAPSLPLALKTLAWFYISEQINPKNSDLPPGHPLSRAVCRTRALALMAELEEVYFKNPPYSDFKGNKALHLLRAIQFVLDRDYLSARGEFGKVLEVSEYLQKERGMNINPQLSRSIEAGIRFCDLMLLGKNLIPPNGTQSVCIKINEQLSFLNSGGTMIDYDAKKIRKELHGVFAEALTGLSKEMKC